MRIIVKVMKKRLEAELISIAHRILQLKHKEDVRELHHETQKLYEKLSVLLFVEEHFSETKPTIGLHDIEVIVEKAFDFDEKISAIKAKEEIIIHDINEEIPPVKAVAEEVKVAIEEPKEVIEEPKATIETPIIEIPKLEKKQIAIDDFLSNMQPEPIFERVSNTKKTEDSKIPAEISKIIDDKIEEKVVPEVKIETEIFFDKVDSKPAINLNDKLNKSVNIGLNDKLAFEKQLFDGSVEDFNRVVSQISTFDSLEDAKNFIEEMVKPDYNDWKGKEEFEERFMEFVASKFV
ncbi:hypothetical protein SAMN05660845_1058 [Flavobacterium swingsii]|uniref:Uncharacterized protein n=2 Tax=Flavobacterium swingsii TaxID=498292 RepID=A0A1I0WXI5_9FLAO|nr:hypothetical protein SAMN05660845_1058 [Flavobacterium swingsii]